MTLDLRDEHVLCIESNTPYFNMLNHILLPEGEETGKSKNLKVDRVLDYSSALETIQARAMAILDTPKSKRSETLKQYDIIFCEYDLGDGKTAQELLEKVRKEGLVPLGTIFIMVATSERRSKVLAVLEFVPDAYITKE